LRVRDSYVARISSPVDAWDAVIVENVFDLRPFVFERDFKLFSERVSAVSHALF
jgi:hypothetical protein